MQRLASHLLIALVGFMALVPQALCPCAVRGRAAAASARSAAPAAREPAPTRAPCCALCAGKALSGPRRAMGSSESGGSTQSGGSTETRAPEQGVPSNCPCCAINGQGKYLLTIGDAVRPEPLQVSAWTYATASLDMLGGTYVCASGGEARALMPAPLPAPHIQRLAGVVLTI